MNNKVNEVKDKLKKEIALGTYKVGEQIPTLSKLCEIYNIGQSTAQKVIGELSADGLIETRGRNGSYVRHCNPNALTNALKEETSQKFTVLVAECFKIGMTEYDMTVLLNEAIQSYREENE